MKFVWAPNPLETVVTLDDGDLCLLRERMRVEELEERIVSARLALDPEYHVSHAKHVKERTVEEWLEEARRWLDDSYLFDGEERNGETFDRYLDRRVANFVEELSGKHCGDCTCVPCSCVKCHAESLLGVDTIAGLGKHSAYKVDGAFADGASIDEAIQKLAAYTPTWKPGGGWKSEEDFQKHVPRWIEEGKQAHEWLVAYRASHWAPQIGSEE